MSSVEADTAPPAPDALMLAHQALNEEARRGTLRHVDLAIITDQLSEREKSSTRSMPLLLWVPSRTPTSPPPPFLRFSRPSTLTVRLAAATTRGRGRRTYSAITTFFAS